MLNFSLRWTLDGNDIGDTGIGYNNKNEVVQFTFPDVDQEGITTTKKSIISFSHSTTAVGTLQCQANYSPGEIWNLEIYLCFPFLVMNLYEHSMFHCKVHDCTEHDPLFPSHN